MTDEYRPYTLIAELTYRCPLRCPYCSNPLEYARQGRELDTQTWLRVLQEAETLGVVQLNLTGGEPLLRDDLERVIEKARSLDLYTNLITSGMPLSFERLVRLRDLGLNSIQVSIQNSNETESDLIAGVPSFHQKVEVMRWVASLDLPLTVNVVLHRSNIGEVPALIELAESVAADRLELANVQYHGWAFQNREWLLPTRKQIEQARTIASDAKRRLRGGMEVLFVTPDYYAEYPKSCMDGWGRRFIVVNPEGLALPCHLAHTLPGLRFDNVKERSLTDIWHHSSGFNQFRGEGWLPHPCKTCDRRAIDFGGCRCQAFQLTGNAGATDPTCRHSADHHQIESACEQANHLNRLPMLFEYRSGREVAQA